MKQFLSAGYFELGANFDSDEGFPQGSPISPALANFCLAGLEKHLGDDYRVVRYADDFVVLGYNETALKNRGIELINGFLNVRGIELNLEKTHIKTVEEGFEFVGLNFREFPDKAIIKGVKRVF